MTVQYIRNHSFAAGQRRFSVINKRRSLSDKPDERVRVSVRVIEKVIEHSSFLCSERRTSVRAEFPGSQTGLAGRKQLHENRVCSSVFGTRQ